MSVQIWILYNNLDIFERKHLDLDAFRLKAIERTLGQSAEIDKLTLVYRCVPDLQTWKLDLSQTLATKTWFDLNNSVK